MSFWKSALVFISTLFILCPFQAQATLTYNSITGVSNLDLTDPTKPIIYVGFTDGCHTNGTTCNSCSGNDGQGNKIFPCNPTSADQNLILDLSLISTNSIPVGSTITVMIGSQTVTFNQLDQGTSTLHLQMLWGSICQAAAGADATCQHSFVNDLVITVNATNTGSGGTTTGTTDTFTYHVVASWVSSLTPTNTFYTDCADGTTTTGTGFCHFSAFPGDSKLYANDLVVSDSGYPNGNSGVPFAHLLFFYEQAADPTEDSQTVIARVTNASQMFSLSVDTSSSPPVSDNRITGLSNGTKYCMVMANQDATGNIFFFTPVPPDVATADSYCALPEPVVGLLDDKHCFIATAAFGSDMAPEVQSFREFRNKFLLPFPMGKEFVKAYYKYSPKYAAMISQNETAKTIVRGALWPLLLFARMSVAFGFWVSLLILMAAAFTFYEMYRRLMVVRKPQGEA